MENINSGGGSGGSLWITAGTIAGSGTISRKRRSGKGSAVVVRGRISLGYTTSAFNGLVSACGGGGYAGVAQEPFTPGQQPVRGQCG